MELGYGNNVQRVQKDPKDLFGDGRDFFAPDAIGAIAPHVNDEIQGALGFGWRGVVEIGEESAGALGALGLRRGLEPGVEEPGYDTAGAEFGGAFVLGVEEHADEGGEERRLDAG